MLHHKGWIQACIRLSVSYIWRYTTTIIHFYCQGDSLRFFFFSPENLNILKPCASLVERKRRKKSYFPYLLSPFQSFCTRAKRTKHHRATVSKSLFYDALTEEHFLIIPYSGNQQISESKYTIEKWNQPSLPRIYYLLFSSPIFVLFFRLCIFIKFNFTMIEFFFFFF